MQNKPTSTAFTRRQFLRGAATLAAAGGAFQLLAACAPAAAPSPGAGAEQAPSQATVTLDVAVYAEPSRTPVQEALWAGFAEVHPELPLAIQASDFSTYYTKLNANIAAGTTPDVFMMSGAYFYNGAMNNAFMPLDDRLAAANIDLNEYFIEDPNMKYQGQTYGIPKEIDIMALAYNITLFDEAGVDYPTDEWTWDDLLDAATKLTRTNADGQQTYGIYSVNNVQEMWGNLVRQNGGRFLTPDLKQAALNTPEAIEAIQFAIDLIYEYQVSPTPQGVSSLPGYIESGGSPFLTGLVAMKSQGNYEMTLLSNITDFEWDVVRMPARKQKGGLGWTQSWVMGAKTPHPDESWTLFEWLITEGEWIMSRVPGRGITPSLRPAAYSEEFVGPARPNMKAWLDGWDIHFDFEFHPAWFEYFGAYSEALDAVFANEVPVETAVAEATEKVNAILARYADFEA
ncbi:MAG: sugar ABC transporter substrate-binding protein [Caldilineaceae bacterium]|nr:sugar ABC transporter substrate-binding protein [Caldilineaceae bacterium]